MTMFKNLIHGKMAILKLHGIIATVSYDANGLPTGEIKALSEWTKDGVAGSEWIDMTQWSINQVKSWLGY